MIFILFNSQLDMSHTQPHQSQPLHPHQSQPHQSHQSQRHHSQRHTHHSDSRKNDRNNDRSERKRQRGSDDCYDQYDNRDNRDRRDNRDNREDKDHQTFGRRGPADLNALRDIRSNSNRLLAAIEYQNLLMEQLIGTEGVRLGNCVFVTDS